MLPIVIVVFREYCHARTGSVEQYTSPNPAVVRCLQERFYFGDTVLPLFESGIPLLRERLKQLPDADNITIAYPDEGAWKRFKYQFGDYPEVRLLTPRTLGASSYCRHCMLKCHCKH